MLEQIFKSHSKIQKRRGNQGWDLLEGFAEYLIQAGLGSAEEDSSPQK